MQSGLERTLALCLLIAAITNVVSAQRVAVAETISFSAVGDACDCAGRIVGIGWGDGYHACKSSGEHCIADLPPRSYAAYQRHQATLRSKACRKQAACSTVYDHFDAGCGDCCDGGCRLSHEHAGCDGGCDHACDSSFEVSPSDGEHSPSRDAVHVHPETAESSPQSSGLTGSTQQASVEPAFRRFIATATPGKIVPVHPYERRSMKQHNASSQQDSGLSAPAMHHQSAGTTARVYPTLVAPRRADPAVSEQNATMPALRQFDGRGASHSQPVHRRAEMVAPESLKTYSTMSEIQGRTARSVSPAVSTLPAWVIEATRDARELPRPAFSPSVVPDAPLIELANRPSYPVDNVIRQPDLQR